MARQSLDTGSEKIQKICNVLRRETLEPAEAEARRIKEEAEAEADKIIAKAEAGARKIEAAAKERIAKERAVFSSSMEQGVRQSVEVLRQQIEKRLFSDQLGVAVAEGSAEPQLVAGLINAIVEAIQKEGVSADLQAVVPKAVKPEEVTSLLLDKVGEVLKGQLQVGDFAGGVKVRLEDKNISIDVSDEAIVELLGHYIRKDFRSILFGS